MKVLEAFGDEAGNGTPTLLVCIAVIEADYESISTGFDELLSSLRGLPQFEHDKGLKRGVFHATENRLEVSNIFFEYLAQLPGIRAFSARALAATRSGTEGERLLECYQHLVRVIQGKYSTYDQISLSIEAGSDSAEIAAALNHHYAGSRPEVVCKEVSKGNLAVLAIPDFIAWAIERLRERIAKDADYRKSFEYTRAMHVRGALSYVRGEDGKPTYQRTSPGIESATMLTARESVN